MEQKNQNNFTIKEYNLSFLVEKLNSKRIDHVFSLLLVQEKYSLTDLKSIKIIYDSKKIGEIIPEDLFLAYPGILLFRLKINNKKYIETFDYPSIKKYNNLYIFKNLIDVYMSNYKIGTIQPGEY